MYYINILQNYEKYCSWQILKVPLSDEIAFTISAQKNRQKNHSDEIYYDNLH